MTTKDVQELKKTEIAKLETLEKIVKMLEDLKNEESVEWIMEKLAE